MQAIFRDRRDAGQRLAGMLTGRLAADALVCGLPRGGVIVAAEVALRLDLPLDVVVARKLAAPGNPEFAIGAVAPGAQVIDEAAVAALRVAPEELEEAVARERLEVRRRLRAYRGTEGPPDVAGREVLLVDDGLATGATARAALRSLRAHGARRVVLAVPVGAPEAVASLRAEADEVVAAATPPWFVAVGAWYEDFEQTSDAEVLAALDDVRAQEGARAPA